MNIIKILLIILTVNSYINAQVIINEFLAQNVSVNADIIDYDDYSDWVELYNNQNTAVDLTGYYITDNLKNPFKWEIPAGTTIQPYSYILFWADGYDAQPGKVSYREYWPWESFTAKRYHTNFKLDFLGDEIGLFKAGGTGTLQIINEGSDWKYLDDGSNQGSGWKENSFDDNNWNSGYAQFGYGDGDETTILGYGNDANNKYITTYFRKTIQIDDPSNITSLKINLLRDDGAIVYLNGNEVIRSNMPSGSVDYQTRAVSALGGTDENTFNLFDISAASLKQGENVFAVELHQANPQSSDISFDMQVTASAVIDTASVVLVDSVKFDRQIQDVSMGRNPDDNYKWYFYGEPTPGTTNNTYATLNNNFASTVSFSLQSGFYQSQQSLQLFAQSPDDEIYYTTDGSNPTTKSNKYLSLNNNQSKYNYQGKNFF